MASRPPFGTPPAPARPLDAHHVGAEITEDHRGVRSGADAGQFDDSQSLQWSRHALPPSVTS